MKKSTPASISRRKFVGNTAKVLTAFFILPRFVLGGKKPDGSMYIAPSDMINLGFIGTGKQGRGLTSTFLETGEVRIIALSEVYRDKGILTLENIKNYYNKNGQAGKYADIPLYNDFRELLARKDIDGVVIATGDTDKVCPGASYGRWIMIKHRNGLSTLYGHLELIKVGQGQEVGVGDTIGYSGNTGYSTGPHLHFTVYVSSAVDVKELPSKSCRGAVFRIPVAAANAYLDPQAYL